MATFTPQIVRWTSSAYDFVYTYDWDTFALDSIANSSLSLQIRLCTGLYPCTLQILGSAGSSLQRIDKGSIACWASDGCSRVSLAAISLLCQNTHSNVTTAPIMIIYETVLFIRDSTFRSCFSDVDGVVVQSFGNAYVSIVSCVFEDIHSIGMGGAIFVAGGQMNINGSVFKNCSADSGGGAIAAVTYESSGSEVQVDTTVLIYTSVFDHCLSEGNGGAIYVISQPTIFFSVILIELYTVELVKCSGYGGGAIFASGADVVTNVKYCRFEACDAKVWGGAVSANDKSQIIVVNSSFFNNSAKGLGGGAIFVNDSIVSIFGSDFVLNSAPAGGGGSLFWQGTVPPEIRNSNMCSHQNFAVYGSCLASAFKYFDVQFVPTQSSPVYPGLSFNIVVLKKDAYNQTIKTDSSSLVQVFPILDASLASDPSLSISGKTIVRMDLGVANFTISIEPLFVVVDSTNENTQLNHLPSIYFAGQDSQTSNQLKMRSFEVHPVLAEGSHICPRGYVLSLTKSSLPAPGICKLCKSGTYSLNPLIGLYVDNPSCLACPLGGECKGGDEITFYTGEWKVSNGIFLLIGCPVGYQLINYDERGAFSQASQWCMRCLPDQYITDSNNASIVCQTCPVGAICNGSSLTSLVNGSVWTVNRNAGVYVLEHCPAGYELLNTAASGDFSFTAQECQICSAGQYCLGGITSAITCPQGTFAPPGSKSSSFCAPAVFVDVTVIMPLLETDFSTAKQEMFLQAIATAVNTSEDNVLISSISQMRRSTDLSIQIVSELAASNQGEASSWAERLNENVLNLELAKRGLPSCMLKSVSVQVQQVSVQSGLNIVAVAVGTAAAAVSLAATIILFFKYRITPASRRLIGAATGTKANQGDLPYELRGRYEAVQVLGCGSYGVVLEAYQLSVVNHSVFSSSTIQTVSRAIKLVHSSLDKFSQAELRRLDREVNSWFYKYFSYF